MFFSRLFFHYSSSSFHYCEYHFHIYFLNCSPHISFSYIHLFYVYTSYYEVVWHCVLETQCVLKSCRSCNWLPSFPALSLVCNVIRLNSISPARGQRRIRSRIATTWKVGFWYSGGASPKSSLSKQRHYITSPTAQRDCIWVIIDLNLSNFYTPVVLILLVYLGTLWVRRKTKETFF